jgi:hypothetical protein
VEKVMAVLYHVGRFRFGELLGVSALTVIGIAAHAETAPPDPHKSDTFVECTILMDKCMPGTSSIIKNIVCAALEKHFKIREDSISCK